MNVKKLLVPAILLLTVFASCKKVQQAHMTGTWQETKLVTYEDSANVKLYDTTYTHPFTSFDFARFNADGTFDSGQDHYYYLNMPHQNNAVQQITPTVGSWDYTAISTPTGTKYVLSLPPGPPNPGGFVFADTVTLVNANTLWLHAVSYGHSFLGISVVSDSYYTK
jgi:hypothetical protein